MIFRLRNIKAKIFYAWCLAFFLCFGLLLATYVLMTHDSFDNVAVKVFKPFQNAVAQSTVKENIERTTIFKTFVSAQTVVPANFKIEIVNTSKELIEAVATAHKNAGNTAIFLNNGEYQLAQTIRITQDNIMFLSVSNNPYRVTIKGVGMRRTNKVQNIFEVRASGFVLDGVRLTDAPNHLIQIAGENNASEAIVRNCVLQDSYEQLLKVSYDQVSRPKNISYNGVVEHCVFQYTRGHAPYYYTGGIDAIGAKNWRVEHNIFKDIASPGKQIAQHAVHFWVNASNNLVRNNIFIDNDRSIGFGMRQKKRENSSLDYFSQGGEISANVIYHSDNGDPFADTGIILEASPDTLVEDNYIFLDHSYPRAIEYRFKETQNATIKNNYTNKPIKSRNGGHAVLIQNDQDLQATDFFIKLQQKLEALRITNLAKPINSESSYD